MGYVVHTAIVVTGRILVDLEMAHEEANRLGLRASEITRPSWTNGYMSFVIPPDGSKYGSPEWEKASSLRLKWTEFMENLELAEETTCEWASIQFGKELQYIKAD